MRGFVSFKTAPATGRYGSELEAALERQSATRREILPMQCVRGPLTNRISKARPAFDWGLDHGSAHNAGTVMLNDFTHWPSDKLDEFRIFGGEPESRGIPPEIIYIVNASIEQHNRFSESAMVPNIYMGARMIGLCS